MSERCDAEMCPYWTGDGCACAVFGIEDDERELFKQQLRAEGFYPTKPTEEDA